MTHSESKYRGALPSWLAGVIATGLIVMGGALYGSYSQRWGPPPDLVAMGESVEEMPEQIGDWIMIDESPMAKSAVDMLECAGYVNRKYQHSKTGQIVDLAIIVGPPGPTAVHTPEICFSSRAYDQETERREVEIVSDDGHAHSFWCLEFITKNVLANRLRVYYAWSPDGTWIASESPRYEYAALPGLYKVQLATEISPGTESTGDDPGKDFLKALIESDWQITNSI